MRTFDPSFFNPIVNLPSVRPNLVNAYAVDGDIDMSPIIMDPSTFAFKGEHGGIFFIEIASGLYEAHSVFVPRASSGRAIRDMAREVCEWMFVHTPAMELVTKVARTNKGADWLSRQTGFVSKWEGEYVGLGHTSFRNLTLDRWLRTSYTVQAEGVHFHEALEEARRKASNHADDDYHDRMAGMASLMMKAGNLDKGAALYNRWACFAGYQPIIVAQRWPVVIDIGDAIIGITHGELEFLQCR